MEIDVFQFLCFVTDLGYKIETDSDSSDNFVVRVNIANEGIQYVFFHSMSKYSVKPTFPLPEHFKNEMEEYFKNSTNSE